MDAATALSIANAGIAAGGLTSGLIGTKKNRKSVEKMNEKQIYLTREMYDKSRQDAVKDRDYENWYNSPQQTMQRLKEAGLNPRLIYGSGGAIQAAANTRQASSDSPSLEAPEIDLRALQAGFEELGSVMSQYVELTNTQAKTDNLRETRELIEAETNAKLQGIQLGSVNIDSAKYNLDYLKRTEPMRIAKQVADVAFTQDENARREHLINLQWLKLEQETEKLGADTRLTEQQRENAKIINENLKIEGKAKAMENAFKAHGINLNANNMLSELRKVMSNTSLMNEIYKIYYNDKK